MREVEAVVKRENERAVAAIEAKKLEVNSRSVLFAFLTFLTLFLTYFSSLFSFFSIYLKSPWIPFIFLPPQAERLMVSLEAASASLREEVRQAKEQSEESDRQVRFIVPAYSIKLGRILHIWVKFHSFIRGWCSYLRCIEWRRSQPSIATLGHTPSFRALLVTTLTLTLILTISLALIPSLT